MSAEKDREPVSAVSSQAGMPAGAVFLSYASEDAAAAQRIAMTLRNAGIEVWFDQSELRGGEAWDQTIRKQIKACALFIPVISRHTHERREGYFRLEWKLAVDRSNLISATQAFLIPVVIDDTREDDEEVPERMHEIHWTRLPAGETSRAFAERVQRLLSGDTSTRIRGGAASGAVPATRGRAPASGRSMRVLSVAAVVVVLGAVAYLRIERPWISKPVASAAFAPPSHSIAVLPFVNMSGDKEQEYFSEGLTEELLNSLARINDLRVAARTSSFSFQGEHPDIATVAHKLNVGAVLEGSVRRSAHKIRITAQLVNGVSGFHLWSQTYDRDLGDMLELQTEIATAVASALKVTLLGDLATKVQLGGTRNPEAFDAFLRGTKAFAGRHVQKDLDMAIAEYTRAIQLDPNYAIAYVARSRATVEKENFAGLRPHDIADAETDARRGVELAPELGEGFAALADAQMHDYEFARADESYGHALAFAPGDVRVLQPYSGFSGILGRFEAAIDAARRAVQLDPLNIDSHATLAAAFYYARRYEESNAAYQDVLTLDPEYADPYQWTFGYMLGKLEETRKRCEKHPDNWGSQVCLAIIYEKLGRHAEAESQLGRLKASNPKQDDWYQYAEIYAQWGNVSEALEFLEKTMRSHHVGIVSMRVDALLDPVRKEPRFQAIERTLKFP